jgi:malate dehydrogenase (oxaloacetate-decarboxylating)(NADP+)
VARREVNIDEYREQLAMRRGLGARVRNMLINKARRSRQRLVYGEGEEPKILRAAAWVADEGIADPILIGDPEIIRARLKDLGLANFAPRIVDPASHERTAEYEEKYYLLRQRRGMTRHEAHTALTNPNVLGPMMVYMHDADAYISGLTYNYPDVIRPALQIFHTQPGIRLASGVYIMIADQKVYLFTDTTVNIEPNADALAEIAILAADFARELDMEPRIAMLSFSNFGSTAHPLSTKVREAAELVRQKRPDLAVDGEVQADFALSADLMQERYPFSQVQDANVLVFPDLEAANIAYKLVAQIGGASKIGPVLLGVGAPVHVLATGDPVEEIVSISAVAAIDARKYKLAGTREA